MPESQKKSDVASNFVLAIPTTSPVPGSIDFCPSLEQYRWRGERRRTAWVTVNFIYKKKILSFLRPEKDTPALSNSFLFNCSSLLFMILSTNLSIFSCFLYFIFTSGFSSLGSSYLSAYNFFFRNSLFTNFFPIF